MQIVDDQQVEAALALEPARARGELGDRDAAGLVDVEGDRLHVAHGLGDPVEILLGDVAAADLVGGHARLLGDDAGGELLGRHFEREEADDAAVDRLHRAVGAQLAAIGAAMLKAMLVASAVLPMPGRPARMTRSEACRPPM